MLYTLSDARTAVGRYVDSGSCNTTTIDARINEALERLMDGEDWECLYRMVRISVCNMCFPLPFTVEKIMWHDINGIPGKVLSQPYQFLSSGPGDLDWRSCGSAYKDLVDMGDKPTMFDVPHEYTLEDGTEVTPEGMRIVAFSEEEADENATMRVRGYDDSSKEIEPGTNPGEDITIHRWQGGVEGTMFGFWDHDVVPSTNYFRDITQIIKPATSGYVTLYAVDTTNNVFFLLGQYHPTQTLPQFRRYRVTNHTLGTRDSILALVKLRFVPLVHANDILPIDSMQALKLMIMSLTQENALNMQGALNLEQAAKKVLAEREKSHTMTDGTPVILNHDFRTSLGRGMNRGGRIM